MYLDKIKPEIINEYKREVSYDQIQTLSYLRQSGYRIYYYFNMPTKEMFYVALCKDIKDCYYHIADPFLAFAIYEDGTIETNYDDYSKAFIIYLYEKESSLTKEEIDSLYKEVSSISELVKGLTGHQAIEKIDARNEFLDFLKKLEKENKVESKQEESDKVKAHLAFEMEDINIGEPRLKYSLTILTSEKNYPIKDLYKFLIGFKTREEYSLSTKKKLVLEPMTFFSPYDRVLPILYTQTSFKNKSKTSSVAIPLKKLVYALEVLKDEPFTFDGKDIKVEDEDFVSFSLDEKGTPVFNPPFENVKGEKYTYAGKNSVLVFYPKEKKICKYLFQDVRMKSTYLYFSEHPIEKFPYIQDIFNDKLLPELSKSLRKSKSSSKEEKKPFEIYLYLTLDEDKGLLFKTTYSENGQEVKDVTSILGTHMRTAYLSLLTSLGGKENGSLKKDDEIVSFLSNDMTPLKNLCQLYCDERLKKKNQVTPNGFYIQMKRQGGYLSLTLDNERFSKEELEGILSAYKMKKKYFLLKNNFVFLKGEELKEVDAVFKNGKLEEEKVPLYALFSLSSGNLTLKEDESCKEILFSLKNFEKHSLSLEKKAETCLRPYQRDGVKYLLSLYDYGFGGILADKMGLGKTFETICFLSSIKEKKPILIITPKAVLYNWESEIHKFSSLTCLVIDANREGREKIISSIKKDKKVLYLISYDTFKRDSELFKDISFSSVILDEAQSIKNSLSKRHQALLSLKSHCKVALTGTPLENSPLDLWSIFDFLMPGYFGNETEFLSLVTNDPKKLSLLLKPFLLRRKKRMS